MVAFWTAAARLAGQTEILDAAEVGVALRFAVEEHAEVVADTLIGCSVPPPLLFSRAAICSSTSG